MRTRTAATSSATGGWFALCPLSIVVFLANSAAAAGAPGEEAELSDAQLIKFAETRVFRFEVDTDGSGFRGSGVALRIEKNEIPILLDNKISENCQGKGSERPRLREGTRHENLCTFVTAYHVVQGAKRICIYDHAGRQVAESSTSTRCFAVRNRDLAFVRLPLFIPGPEPDQRLKKGLMGEWR